WSIQLPPTRITRATPASLGTKVSVTSWTWVTVCSSETSTPMARETIRIGAASLTLTMSALVAMSMTRVSVTGLFSLEAGEQRTHDERPAVDHHEQQELERERDEHRRQHHHSHRHQRRADDEVDHEERHEHDEADDERRLQLGEDERRDER